ALGELADQRRDEVGRVGQVRLGARAALGEVQDARIGREPGDLERLLCARLGGLVFRAPRGGEKQRGRERPCGPTHGRYPSRPSACCSTTCALAKLARAAFSDEIAATRSCWNCSTWKLVVISTCLRASSAFNCSRARSMLLRAALTDSAWYSIW